MQRFGGRSGRVHGGRFAALVIGLAGVLNAAPAGSQIRWGPGHTPDPDTPAEDPHILERIQHLGSPDKGVRASPFGPGPIVLVRRLRAHETYRFTVEARRNEVLRVAAIGDGDTNIDLTIRDRRGAVVCTDGSRDHYPVCTLHHPEAGTLRVEVVNRGNVWSRVQILTNLGCSSASSDGGAQSG